MTLDRLTPRQRQVITLAADGLTYDEIGEELGISHRTIRHHMLQARTQLGMGSRYDMVARLLGETDEDLSDHLNRARRLTDKQKRLLYLITDGATYREIAALTDMNVDSVRSAASRLYVRLGLRNRGRRYGAQSRGRLIRIGRLLQAEERMAAQSRLGLSKREGEIAQLAAEGLTNWAIGRRLGITQSTVANTMKRIYERMGLADRTQLVVLALRRKAVNGRDAEDSIMAQAAVRLAADDGGNYQW